MNTYTIHPLCELFPPMSGDEFASLKESIAKNGVRDPIVVHQGQIVDGRHRWRACQELGRPCPAVEWNGEGSLTDLVLARNLHRRSLTTSQRTMIAANAIPFWEAEARARMVAGKSDPEANLPQGVETRTKEREPQARDHAAKAAGVSGRSVQTAKTVAKEAPDLAEKVKKGEMTVSAAAKEVQTRKGPPPPRSQKPADKDVPLDALDRPIKDEKVVEAFAGREAGKELMNRLSKLKSDIAAFAETTAGAYLQGPPLKDIESVLAQTRHRIGSYLPHTTCPRMPNCRTGCKLCRGTRFVTAEMYKNLPSEEK